MPEHMLVSETDQRVGVIGDAGRRRYWPAAEKLRIVTDALESGDSISAVARRNGVAPNLLYRWRRLMLEGGSVAVQSDDGVTGNGQERRHLMDRTHEIAPSGQARHHVVERCLHHRAMAV